MMMRGPGHFESLHSDRAWRGVDPPSSFTYFRSVLPRAMIFCDKVSANTRHEKDFANGINSIKARSYSVDVVCGRDSKGARGCYGWE
jgi:hypothetical protein